MFGLFGLLALLGVGRPRAGATPAAAPPQPDAGRAPPTSPVLPAGVGLELVSEVELEKVLAASLAALRQSAQSTDAAVAIRGHDGTVTARVAGSADPERVGASIVDTEVATRLAWDSGRPGGLRSGLIVPLDGVEGAVAVYSRTPSAFDGSASDGVAEVARWCAAAIRNALRLADAERKLLLDPLTGAESRAAFDRALPEQISLARRRSEKSRGGPADLCLLFIDVDRFHDLNREHTQGVMDTVLRELVVVFRDRLRVSDRVFRYSTAADEFLILLPEATLPDAASLCRQRLFEAIETHRFAVDDITLSVGLGQLREADTEEELVKRSDVAMGVAKEESRHRNTLVLDDDPRVEQGPSPGSAGSA